MKKISNKTILFLGLLFVFLSFVSITAVFYQVMQNNQEIVQEAEAAKKNLKEAEDQRRAAQQQAQEAAERMGRGIEFGRLISVAEKKYGPEEFSRREGDLWIDRQGKEWMATLGALNAVKKGSRLHVMQGGKKIGMVAATTVLDVVSYVYPVEDRGQFTEDIYQVVLEEE